MVAVNSHTLNNLLNNFDPKSEEQFEVLEKLIELYPTFHLIRPYYLKAVQQLDPKNFDKVLSHTAIATYDRELLYEFIENQSIDAKGIKRIDNKLIHEQNRTDEKHKEPKSLSFSEWASYIKMNKDQKKKIKIADKFKLIDSFLDNKKKIVADRDAINNEDLSEKSWIASDELMTETLAKVFVRQKKYDKALQAFKILGLKYPEKNSFFADQIKNIKKIQKQKN